MALLFPVLTGKVAIADLFVKMDEPVDSKLYLPRPLELYTVDELSKVVPKGMSHWNNRYEDPMEPVKCWTWEEFSGIYNKPGFHFMLARVAQIGPQCKDPKLSMLRLKLATCWNCSVALQKMDPRQDWMLCTVPSNSEGEKDVLKYDLICLTEGNAVYVIRRFALAGRARDLEWVVKGSLADNNSIYTQMRKHLLDFEMSDTQLGWHVLGVRKAGATSKFQGTFILDSATVYWPWTMSWGHKHSSVPDSSPLLNFDPTWSARRPYACQCCYSMDHFTEECPLPFMKVGSMSLVSHPARTLVIRKKAAERIISLEKSAWELPVPCTPAQVPASPLCPTVKEPCPCPKAPMSAIAEESTGLTAEDKSVTDNDMHMSLAAPPPEDGPPYEVIDSLIKFLMLQLHGNITTGLGLTEAWIQSLCKVHKGSLLAVLNTLRNGGWLPASVSNQVMSFEYDRFLIGSLSPRVSGRMIGTMVNDAHTDMTSLTHNCLGSEPILTPGTVRQEVPVGNEAATCTRIYAMLQLHGVLTTMMYRLTPYHAHWCCGENSPPLPVPQSESRDASHISDTLPPADAAPTQSMIHREPQLLSQEIQISLTRRVTKP